MNYLWVGFLGTSLFFEMAIAASAQPESPAPPNLRNSPLSIDRQLELDPQVLENSPVLQRWTEEVPNVLSEIRNDPSFRTRVRVGYSHFSSRDQTNGMYLGVEDVFLPKTRLTVSADYQASDGTGGAYGSELRYYVLPLGSSVNLAPVVGYRWLETEQYSIDGANLGLRLQLQLSRTGAADIALTQSWVNPTSKTEEVGLTTLTFGYALTHDLRLSTDLQQRNASQNKDRRVSLGLEWML